MNGIELEIHELLEQAVEYLNSRDLDSLIKMWDNSAVLMLPATPALYGKQGISKWLENHMNFFGYDLEIDIGDIKPDGKLACVSGRFIIHIRNLLNKCICIHNGKFLIVMSIDNSDLEDSYQPLWNIYCCCSNSSLPPSSTQKWDCLI